MRAGQAGDTDQVLCGPGSGFVWTKLNLATRCRCFEAVEFALFEQVKCGPLFQESGDLTGDAFPAGPASASPKRPPVGPQTLA